MHTFTSNSLIIPEFLKILAVIQGINLRNLVSRISFRLKSKRLIQNMLY
jgi:hypothetical protein